MEKAAVTAHMSLKLVFDPEHPFIKKETNWNLLFDFLLYRTDIVLTYAKPLGGSSSPSLKTGMKNSFPHAVFSGHHIKTNKKNPQMILPLISFINITGAFFCAVLPLC